MEWIERMEGSGVDVLDGRMERMDEVELKFWMERSRLRLARRWFN